jgi:hypothetical protein
MLGTAESRRPVLAPMLPAPTAAITGAAPAITDLGARRFQAAGAEAASERLCGAYAALTRVCWSLYVSPRSAFSTSEAGGSKRSP